jgi:endoglucanase
MRTRFRRIVGCVGLVTLIGSLIALATAGAAVAAPRARQAALCSVQDAQRFELNPHVASGVDPLRGARFFLDGPGTNRGFAASAIAQQINRDPNSFGNISWPAFQQYVDAAQLSAGVAHRVHLLEKIGSEPEVKRFSVYSAGGGPGAIKSQVEKLLCRMQKTDPGADALISTYFLKHSGYCPTNREIGADASAFRRHIDELTAGIGEFPSVVLLETDGIDTAGCLSSAGLRDREGLLAYAIDKLSKLPHTVTYVEGGTEDANSVTFAARVLNKIGVNKIRGFFVNDTHFNWTINEIKYGQKVSKLTGGTHFIVGTQTNGRGPRLNPHPVTQGIEDLCNPPGRGLGRRLTTDTGYQSNNVDAFMWVGVPGRSAGSCGAGNAPAGMFDLTLALNLASNANERLGPGFPSDPY